MEPADYRIAIIFHSDVMTCLLRLFFVDISAAIGPDSISDCVIGSRTSSFEDEIS